MPIVLPETDTKPDNLNRKDYNQAVKNHSDGIYRYACKFLRDQAAAQDVVQDAFEKLWKERKKVDGQKVKSWLFRTAHNQMINQIKRDKRMQSMDTVSSEPQYQAKFRFELSDILEQCIAKLPAQQQSILLLRDLEGYAYKEIGEMLGLTESQVKVYLFRARKKMQSEIKGVYQLR